MQATCHHAPSRSDAGILSARGEAVHHRRGCATLADTERPYLRKRYMVATPPETWEGNHYEYPAHRQKMEFLGLHPGFGGHHHSPALEVLPNGDLLMVAYSSWTEYNPEVALMAVRLRYGHDQWEMPSFGFDLPGVNDHAPLLWTDGDATHLFWGAPNYRCMSRFSGHRHMTTAPLGSRFSSLSLAGHPASAVHNQSTRRFATAMGRSSYPATGRKTPQNRSCGQAAMK